jgi:hypothetical protein
MATVATGFYEHYELEDVILDALNDLLIDNTKGMKKIPTMSYLPIIKNIIHELYISNKDCNLKTLVSAYMYLRLHFSLWHSSDMAYIAESKGKNRGSKRRFKNPRSLKQVYEYARELRDAAESGQVSSAFFEWYADAHGIELYELDLNLEFPELDDEFDYIDDFQPYYIDYADFQEPYEKESTVVASTSERKILNERPADIIKASGFNPNEVRTFLFCGPHHFPIQSSLFNYAEPLPLHLALVRCFALLGKAKIVYECSAEPNMLYSEYVRFLAPNVAYLDAIHYDPESRTRDPRLSSDQKEGETKTRTETKLSNILMRPGNPAGNLILPGKIEMPAVSRSAVDFPARDQSAVRRLPFDFAPEAKPEGKPAQLIENLHVPPPIDVPFSFFPVTPSPAPARPAPEVVPAPPQAVVASKKPEVAPLAELPKVQVKKSRKKAVAAPAPLAGVEPAPAASSTVVVGSSTVRVSKRTLIPPMYNAQYCRFLADLKPSAPSSEETRKAFMATVVTEALVKGTIDLPVDDPSMIVIAPEGAASFPAAVKNALVHATIIKTHTGKLYFTIPRHFFQTCADQLVTAVSSKNQKRSFCVSHVKWSSPDPSLDVLYTDDPALVGMAEPHSLEDDGYWSKPSPGQVTMSRTTTVGKSPIVASVSTIEGTLKSDIIAYKCNSVAGTCGNVVKSVDGKALGIHIGRLNDKNMFLKITSSHFASLKPFLGF